MKRTSCGSDALIVPKVLVPIRPGRAHSTMRGDRVEGRAGSTKSEPPAQHGPAATDGIALVLVTILGLVALAAVFSGGSVEAGWDFGPGRDLR